MATSLRPVEPPDPTLDALRARLEARRRARAQPPEEPLDAPPEEVNLDLQLRKLRERQASREFGAASAIADYGQGMRPDVAAVAPPPELVPRAPGPEIRGVTGPELRNQEIAEQLREEAISRGKPRALIPTGSTAAWAERAIGRALAHLPGAAGEFGERTAALGEQHEYERQLAKEELPFLATLPADLGSLYFELATANKIPGLRALVSQPGHVPIMGSIAGGLTRPGATATIGRILRQSGREAARFGSLEAAKGIGEQAPAEDVLAQTLAGAAGGAAFGAGVQGLRELTARATLWWLAGARRERPFRETRLPAGPPVAGTAEAPAPTRGLLAPGRPEPRAEAPPPPPPEPPAAPPPPKPAPIQPTPTPPPPERPTEVRVEGGALRRVEPTPGPAEIVQMRTTDIVADPTRFQFKSLGEGGVSPELKGVTKWNPNLAGVISVWKDPADGKTYVVNGHHRLDLAQRLDVQTVNVQYIDAATAKEARAEGAFINIAEGRGTATDVAKFMRDVENPEEVMRLKGLSLRGDLAKNGLALSKLTQDIFDQVATQKVPASWGIAIGGELPGEPDLQRTALKLVRDAKGTMSIAEVRELAKQVKAAGTEGVTQETLFGAQRGEASLFVPRARIAASLQRQLATDKRLFSYVSKGARPEELERAGATTIDVEAAKGLATSSAQLEELFTRLSTRTGPLAEVLTAGARRVAHGEAVGDVARELYPDVRRAIEEDLGRPVAPHGPERPAVKVEGSVAAQTAAEAEQPPVVETSKDINQAKLLEPRAIIAQAAQEIADAVKAALRPEPPTAAEGAVRYSRRDPHGQAVARALKSPEDPLFETAVDVAATAMVRLVPPGSVLVPVPSSTGSTAANRTLAEEIASRVEGAEVADVLARRETAPSSRARRREGQPGLTAEQQAASMVARGTVPRDRTVVLIDNVETTGATAEGARAALQRPDAKLATYAEAPPPKGERRVEPGTVARYEPLEGGQSVAEEHAETTFGSIAEAKRAAQEVVRSAGAAAQIDLFGQPVPRDPAAREVAVARADLPRAWVPIKGQAPKTPEELHGLLWPFRNPRMERMHYLLLDANGVVIEHQMWTSGAISYVQMVGDFVQDLIADMRRAGAVEVILAHNHPSGLPEESKDDVTFTGAVSQTLQRDAPDLKLRGQYVIDDITGTWIQDHGDHATIHPVQLPRAPTPTDWTATQGPQAEGTGVPMFGTTKRNIVPPDVAKVILATSGVLPAGRMDVLYFNTQAVVVALEPHAVGAARDARRWFPERLRALAADWAIVVVGGGQSSVYANTLLGFRGVEGVMDVFQVWQPQGEANPRWTSASASQIFHPQHAGDLPAVLAHRVFERAQRPRSDLPAEAPKGVAEPGPNLPAPTLSILHNLTPENLAAADRLGGFPVPSMAVLPEHLDFDQYGPITLIGKAELGDPAKTEIYDSDAYTGRNPPPLYPVVQTKRAEQFLAQFRDVAKEFGEGWFLGQVWDELVNRGTGPRPGELAWTIQKSLTARALYLRSLGREARPVIRDVPQRVSISAMPAMQQFFATHGVNNDSRPGDPYWAAMSEAASQAITEYARGKAAGDDIDYGVFEAALRNRLFDDDTKELAFGPAYSLFTDAENVGKREVDPHETANALFKSDADEGGQREPAYQQWVERLIKPLFGPPFLRLRGKKVPYTLENVVAATKGKPASEGGMTFGPGSARATATVRFTDLTWMRNAAYRIAARADVDKARDELDDLQGPWRDSMIGYYRPYGNEQGGTWEALDAMHRALGRWGKIRGGRGRTVSNLRRQLAREGFRNVPIEELELGVQVGKGILESPVPYFEAKPTRAVDFNEFAGAVVPLNAPESVREILDRRGIPYRTYDNAEHRADVTRTFRRELHDRGVATVFERRRLPQVSEESAFHGTRYRFDKFEQEKIGTGQGAASYGHGFYFSQVPGTARHYRETLSADRAVLNWVVGKLPPLMTNGQKIDTLDATEGRTALEQVVRGGVIEQFLARESQFREVASEPQALRRVAMEIIQKQIDEWEETWPEAAAVAGQIQMGIAENGVAFDLDERPGAVYHVTLNVQPNEWLDWDKRLTEQSPLVEKALTDLGVPVELYRDREKAKAAVDAIVAKPATREGTDEDLERTKEFDAAYNRLLDIENDLAKLGWSPASTPHGGAAYRILNNQARVTSHQLHKRGVKGNRYLDQLSRAPGAVAKTYNYVVFKAEDIGRPLRVEERGAKPPAPPRRPVTPQVSGPLRPEDEAQQGSMFGAKAGTAASRSLAQAEAQARRDVERLRQEFAAAKDNATRTRLAAEISELEKLVNRDRALTADEMARRAAAAPADERLPIDPTQTSLFEKGPQYDPEGGFAKLPDVAGFLKRNFTSQGDLPPVAFEKNIERVGRINSTMRQTVFTMRLLRRALAAAGWRRPTAAQLEILDDALKGGPLDGVPAPVRPVLAQMRQEMDILSRRLIDEGVIEGPLVPKVEANLGLYATRSYRVFDDPDWAKKVPTDVRNKFRALLRAEYPDMSDEDLEGLFNTFLYRGEDSPITILKKAALGSKDLSILTRRKDIAPELRALWGEYRDPRVNYARSVVKMAHLIENHRFLREMLEAGFGRFFHQQPTVRGDVSYHTQFAAEGSKMLEPLNGLYTSPEIAEAFRQLDDMTKDPAWLRLYYIANGAAKYAKTVGSVVTHVRNVLSNVGFATANGHWRVLKAGSAVQANVANLLGNNQKWQAYYRKLVELGVVHESVTVGELGDALRDAHVAADQPDKLAIPRRILGAAEALYRAEDEVWKVYAFENELARYRKAYPKMTQAEVEKKAASIVRRTWPTYSLVPRGIKLLRRFPLVGPFVSFPAEVVRNTANTMRVALEELGNPATAGIGAQRIVGLILAAVAIPAVIQGGRDLMGLTKDDDEDMRQLAPPWSENGALLVVNRDAETVRYVDLSYVDPYSVIRRPLIAMLRDRPWEQNLASAANELAKPFLGEELVASKLLDVARNLTEQGRQVYNEADPPEKQAQDVLEHVGQVFVPGTAESLNRVKKGFQGEVSGSGRQFVPEVELGAMLTGQRVMTINLGQALRSKGLAFQKRVDDSRRIFLGTAMRAGAVSDADIADAYQRSEAAREEAFANYGRVLLAAQRLGLPRREALMVLREVGVSHETISDLLNGGYTPYRPGPQVLRRMRGLEGRLDQWRELRRSRRRPADRQEP